MRIWRFTDPSDYRFAEAGRRGSWTQPSEGLCPECTASREERTRPLILAWLPGSDIVGDFVWPGFDSEVVVTDDVLGALQPHFHGFEPGSVDMVEEKGVRAAKRGDRQVRLPYRGPRLHELWVTAWVHLDPGRSSVELKRRCSTCGTERWEVNGTEHLESHYDLEREKLVRTRIDRLPDAGLFVDEAELGEASIFRVHELPAWVFCTDPVRELTTEQGFSNVAFLEMGETFV